MTNRPSQPNRSTNQRIMLGLGILVLACIVCSVPLALAESLTSFKPYTQFFLRVSGRQTLQATKVAEVAPFATNTPTVTPIPPTFTPTPPPPTPTATPVPPTDTPTLVPTDTATPTPLPPTPTSPPTATPTETIVPPTPTTAPSSTPTPSPTPTSTPTPDATDIAVSAQSTATAQAARPQASPTPRPPAGPALTGIVAFPAFNTTSGTYEVFVANIDGSNLRQVAGQASQPDLTNDGRSLAYRSWQGDKRGLHSVNLDGSNGQRRTVFLEDAGPNWSADGGELIFFSRRESDRQPRIFTYGVHNGSENTLLSGGVAIFGEMPVWMPDRRVLFRVTFPTKGIAIVNADGSNQTIIISDDTATSPAISPNGNFITYMAQSEGNWEIYRADSNGSNIVRLTQNAANDGLPVWSPDGRGIAFVSDRGGQWALWVMSTNGNNQQQLFTLPGPIDGRVRGEPADITRGWVEESISWSR